MDLENRIARMIIGPKNELPKDSKFTLDELREAKWKMADMSEKGIALWSAKTIIRELNLCPQN